MATLEVTLSVKVRWWVKPYLAMLEGFCFLMNTEPDSLKVAQFISKHGIKIEVK